MRAAGRQGAAIHHQSSSDHSCLIYPEMFSSSTFCLAPPSPQYFHILQSVPHKHPAVSSVRVHSLASTAGNELSQRLKLNNHPTRAYSWLKVPTMYYHNNNIIYNIFLMAMALGYKSLIKIRCVSHFTYKKIYQSFFVSLNSSCLYVLLSFISLSLLREPFKKKC